MVNANAPIVAYVIRQHADDAVALAVIRKRMVSAPHVKLAHLRRADERLLAHLDGLAIAGEEAARFFEEALASPGEPEVFVAAVRAIEDRSRERLDRIVRLVQAVPASTSGLVAAFGWVRKEHLQGLVVDMLASHDPFAQAAAIAACAQHGVDPSRGSLRGLNEASLVVRRRVLQALGEVGQNESVAACVTAVADDDPDTGFWAARSAVLLGNRGVALDALQRMALQGPSRQDALRLALLASECGRGHRLLQELATDPGDLRLLILGSGVVGDPAYVPWLIGQMSADATARIAGEAFSTITGADLAMLDLERKPPDDFESGPSDNTEDPNVDIDADDGLPWPDAKLVESWWTANGASFAAGQRYFGGSTVTREHCIDVLRNGYQRHRLLAAEHLCLLEPGTPLFNTSSPAWRQQRLLAKM